MPSDKSTHICFFVAAFDHISIKQFVSANEIYVSTTIILLILKAAQKSHDI